MKKTKFMTRIIAAVFALAILFAMSVPAWAVSDLSSESATVGTVGSTSSTISDESVNIKKALKVYNIDTVNDIYAPTISYTYTITAGSADKTVTDNANGKNNTLAGIIPGLKVTGVSAATATTSTGANTEVVASENATSVANTIAWSSYETVSADTNGIENYKNLKLDFSNVNFGRAGIFRYVITETYDTNAYTSSGVTETVTNATTGNKHIRYLDVYVKDGTSTDAAAWDVYGFVCFYQDSNITSGATDNVGKTPGFVDGTADGTNNVSADSYYTHNISITKSLTGDNYSNSHQFPMTVLFSNTNVSAGTQLKVTTSGATTPLVTDYTRAANGSITSGALNGVVKVAKDMTVKYSGIPNGTTTTIYETNDVHATTYRTTITTDNTAGTGKVINWTDTTPTTAVAHGSSNVYESNTATFTTTASNVDDDTNHTFVVANVLETISPTGLAFRIAPYALMLAAGVSLIVLFIKRKENEATDMI